MRNKKGFTLIELIIILAIMGVVMTAVSSFFIGNLDAFKHASNQVDVQSGSYIAMENMMINVMESQKIIKYDQVHGEYIFKIDDGKYIKYKYDDVNKKVQMGEGVSSSSIVVSDLASDIIEFKISMKDSSDNDTNDKASARGIKIAIKSKKGSSNVEIKNTVFFRN